MIFYTTNKKRNFILKNSYLDYKVFVVPEIDQTGCIISGDNYKHILIGILSENNAELDAFLEKIITAAKLSLKTDCLAINVAENHNFPSFSNVFLGNNIEKAVFFGLKPKDLGLNITPPQYLPFLFNDCTFLFADPLSKIFNSADLKRALWSALQRMFL